MTQISNVEEARQIATLLKSRPDLDPAVREGMTQSLRDFAEQNPAPPANGQQAAGQSFKHPRQVVLEEGVKQLAAVGGGIANAALDVAEFFTVAGQSLNPEDSLPGVEAGLNSTRQGIRDTRRAMNTAASAGLSEAFGTPEFPEAGQFVGEMIAFYPLSVLSRGRTLTRAVAGGFGETALATGAAGAPDAEGFLDLVGDMTIGGLLGAGATGTLLSAPGLISYVGRKHSEMLDTQLGQNTLKLEREVQQMTGNPDFSFTTAQIGADNPWLAGLEVGTSRRGALKRQTESLKTLEGFIAKRAAGRAPREVVLDLHNTMNKAASEMQNIATQRYSVGLDRLINKFGDSVQVDGLAYRGALNEYMEEYAQAQARGLAGPPPALLTSHMQWVDNKVLPFRVAKSGDGWAVISKETGEVIETHPSKKVATGRMAVRNENEGGLTIEDTQVVLKQFNKFINGPTGAFDEAAGSLGDMSRVLKAKFMQGLEGRSGPAVQELQRMNRTYQYDMTQLNSLKQSALGTIFGAKDDLPALLNNPQGALDRLIRETGDPAALTASRKLLQTHAPALLEDLKSSVLRRVLQGSRSARTPSAISQVGEGTEIDLNQFANALAGPGRSETAGRVGLGLFTPGEQSDLINAARALQVLNNTYFQRAVSDTAGTAGDIAINAVSRSAEFATRLGIRMITKGSTVEKIMVDPAGRRLLIQAAENGPDSPAFKSAIAALAYRVGAAERVSDNEENQKILQEQSIRPEGF